jgi:hypothetical protein
MINYDGMLAITKKIERDLFEIADTTKEQKQQLINILNDVRLVRDKIQFLIDDQQAEMTSMAEEFERIEKLNEKLGKLLNEK